MGVFGGGGGIDLQSLGLETMLNFGADGESPIRQSSTSRPKN